jgi:hypothetical protein
MGHKWGRGHCNINDNITVIECERQMANPSRLRPEFSCCCVTCVYKNKIPELWPMHGSYIHTYIHTSNDDASRHLIVDDLPVVVGSNC